MAEFLRLKKSNCKNCYKCIRNCPVKSIRFSGNQAHIVSDECILCGHCFVVCPQNAKEIDDQTEKVKFLLQGDAPVYVSLAPSFIALFDDVGIDEMESALKQLGFAGAEETAIGATMVKNEYERILDEENRDILITSCCPSVNLLIQKYYAHLLPHLADVMSPMEAHCIDIKKRHPGCKTVFIGPCLAKMDEADRYESGVDAVLTFENLSEWFKEKNVEPKQIVNDKPQSRTRLFPTAGGIIESLSKKRDDYTYLTVDGAENCISVLEELRGGELHNCFIEMSICHGSCVGGPVMEKYRHTPLSHIKAVRDFAGNEDFDVQDEEAIRKAFPIINRSISEPSEKELNDILLKMGKKTPADELNCGSCGYDTCREKAKAIFLGKADVSMCLPYLMKKTETFSDNITRNTPNGIVVVNDELEVQQINRSALNLMNIKYASDVVGDYINRILDTDDFENVLKTGRSLKDKREYLAEYGKFIEKTIIRDRESGVMICIMRDVTAEEDERRKKEEISAKTVEIADNVVDKQMRIVQEIASLLGETTAETKIALTKLKESIKDE